MKIAAVPRAIQRIQRARETRPLLAAALPMGALRVARRLWANNARYRKRRCKWLAEPAPQPILALVSGLEHGGRWLASVNAVIIGLFCAYLVSVYAEMFPGYAEAAQRGCVLAQAGARNVAGALGMAQFFMVAGVLAIAAAAGVNFRKLLWSARFLFFARVPPRGVSEPSPKWVMSYRSAVNTAAFQTACIGLATLITSAGAYATMVGIGRESPEVLMQWQETYHATCRKYLEDVEEQRRRRLDEVP